jgi:AcrR family transcriptional regulator
MSDRDSRKKQITERRQGQILNAAMEVFSKKGYTSATIPEIARLAGVAAGTIYIYYPSKRELFIALLKKIGHTVAMLNIIERMPVAGFPTVFKNILQNQLAIARSTNMSSFLSLWGDIEREPELKAQLVRQLFQPAISQMEDFYRSRVAAGEFRQLDPAVAVRAMPAMTIGLTVLDKFEGDEGPLHRLPEDELADRINDILLNGLLSRERKDEK